MSAIRIPEALQRAIAAEGAREFQALCVAREELTANYRDNGSKRAVMATLSQRHAYLISRLPATYAAVACVVDELLFRFPDGFRLTSALDCGAGPGTAMWALCERFSNCQFTLVEREGALIALGKRLAQQSCSPLLRQATWLLQDMAKSSYPTADLVLFSYSLGELPEVVIRTAIENAWYAANQFLILIEPGTPVGFATISAARSQLIALGAHLVAPCPHAGRCPIEKGDWCHFSQRLERSSLHRRIKGGTLSYEDEKFSYLIASKLPALLPKARILRHPLRRPGHLHFTLCTPHGIVRETLSKSQPFYKEARELTWGDSIAVSQLPGRLKSDPP